MNTLRHSSVSQTDYDSSRWNLVCRVLSVVAATLILPILCFAADIQLVPVVSGLSSPVFVTHAHDGSNRLFIVEQPGIIKVLHRGASTPTVFLDIRSKVVFGGERGLLGLAFHPQLPANRRFFVDYTRAGDGATVIASYEVSENPDLADPTETVLLVIPQPYANHNGGMLAFGPDGYLYIGMGDGGSSFDPENRAQDINQLLGKILRIDVDHSNGPTLYSSPPTNPFFGSIPGADEIYAFGFRNPWRFSFDRGTGTLYVGDVGQDEREEVDIVTLGGNFGWRVWEGTRCTGLSPDPTCSGTSYIFPVIEYTHVLGRCSITGGYVYRGTEDSLPQGSYVFGDYCSGEIFISEGGSTRVLSDTSYAISSFGEDESGEIYVVNLNGTIDRIAAPSLRFVPVTPCRIMDTRDGFGFSGPFGPPFISGNTVRTVPIPSSPCGIPPQAKAYSLNATVVPHGSLGYLTLWPSGIAQPFVSTLNAYDAQVTANAAIVRAGVAGAIAAFATNDTDLILDINGYFINPTSTEALEFYPVTPCRVFDTRNPDGTFGGPPLAGQSTRSIPITSGSCGIPTTAQAYALNATVVPSGFLNYLTLWPSGSAQPLVSTLNAYEGQVTANMAIVPAGSDGAVNAFASQDTHVILDITGYFAPPVQGGLRLMTMTPCRIVDTRAGSGFSGAFGPPSLVGGATRTFPIPTNTTCSVPTTAQAYSLNVTIVTPGFVNWITLFPTGQPLPNVSTLNGYVGTVFANAANIAAGTSGSVDVFASDNTDIIIDINGYYVAQTGTTLAQDAAVPTSRSGMSSSFRYWR